MGGAWLFVVYLYGDMGVIMCLIECGVDMWCISGCGGG